MKQSFEICYAHIAKANDEIKILSREISKIDINDLWSLKEIAAPPFADRSDWIIKVSPLPSALSVIAANILHQLRIPLDQMLTIYYSSIIATRPVPREISFPVANSAEALRARLKNLSKINFSERTLNYLSQLEPFLGGMGEDFWRIHALDIASKHHGTLTAKSTAAKVYFFNRGFYEGILYRIGQMNGPNLINLNPGVPGQEHLQAPSDSLRPIYQEINGRSCIECEIINPELPIFRTSLGIDTIGILEVVPELAVVLGDGETEEREPVDFLRRVSGKVRKVLDDFVDLAPKE